MRRLLSLPTVLLIGASLLSLTVHPTPALAAYAGENGSIAYVRAGQIYTIDPATSAVQALTRRGTNAHPVWSPDGSRIAFLHTPLGSGPDVWVMDGDGSNKQQVTHLGNVQGPSWSPDGRWLAFGSPLQRVRSNAPFGEPEILGARVQNDCCQDAPWDVRGKVAWSADGDHIAFISGDFPSSPDTYLLEYSLRTHEIAALDAIGGSCCGEGTFADPFYASDGRGPYITIDKDPGPDDPNDYPPELYTENSHAVPFPSEPYDQQGALSPDDRAITFANNATGRWRIYTENLNGRHRTNLSAGSQPDWQPTSTVPWVAPPPPDPDTIKPLLTFDYPATFRVGRTVSTSDYFNVDTSDDYTRAPMRFDWTGSDPETGICGYDVADQRGHAVVSDTQRTHLFGSGNNKSYNFYNIAARDCAGNTSSGDWFRVINVADDSGLGPDSFLGPVTFTGTWAVSNCQCWSGGTTHKTYQGGAASSLKLYGASSVGIVMAKGPDRGQAAVYLNGDYVRTVDTYSPTGRNRVVMANVQTPPNQESTITIVNLGTAGHSRIDIDAFLVTN